MRQAEKGEKEGGRRRWLMGLVVVAALVLYWGGNARTPLWDRDEGRFAEAAREMIETGDYVVPRFQGEVRYDKPILGYWFFVGGMKFFGVNEFGARFSSGLFGALSVLVLFLLARRMSGSGRVGLYSAAILATAPVMFVESKLCTVDAGLLFWLLVAFSGLWRIYEGECRWRPKALFWTGLALAVLTKGPVALAAVFVPVALIAVFSRDRSFLRRMGWAWGVVLFVMICVPWAWAVQAKTGGQFLNVALGKHVIERSLRTFEGHGGFPGFYVVTLFGTFFPWAFFVPGALVEAVRGLREKRREIFLVSWAVGLIVVLECVRTKMVHYSLPVFPALSILVALFFERARAAGDRRLLPGAIAAFIMALVLAAGPPVALYRAGMTEAVIAFVCAGVFLVAGMARAVCLSKRGRGAGFGFAGMAAWFFVVAAWGLPSVGGYSATGRIVAAVDNARILLGGGAEISSLGYEEPSLVFYLDGRVEVLKRFEEEGSAAARLPRILILSKRNEGVLRDVPNRRLESVETVDGFNFAKGRWEEVMVYLDYGEPLGRGRM